MSSVKAAGNYVKAVENYDKAKSAIELLEAKHATESTDESKKLIANARHTLMIASIFLRASDPRLVTAYDEKFIDAVEQERVVTITANNYAKIYLEAKAKSDETNNSVDLAATKVASDNSKQAERVVAMYQVATVDAAVDANDHSNQPVVD